MIFVVDNYDSFTYNLVQYLAESDPDVRVARNDAFDIDDLLGGQRPDRIVVSPGPGRPEDAGRSLPQPFDLVSRGAGKQYHEFPSVTQLGGHNQRTFGSRRTVKQYPHWLVPNRLPSRRPLLDPSQAPSRRPRRRCRWGRPPTHRLPATG